MAGGEGRRLRPLSYYFQKCMIPIGDKQKPLLEYIIFLLKHHRITEITLLVGYKHEQIVNYFDDGSRFGVELSYVQDEPSTKGTGGSLINLHQKGFLDHKDSILIYYGDILSNINLTDMLEQHINRKAAATLVLAQGYKVPVGVAELKGDNIIKWTEKPVMDITVGIGILALESKILSELHYLNEERKETDIMRDILPFLIENDHTVNAYITNGFWYDVGSTEKYEKLDNGIVEENFSDILNLT